MPVDVDYPNLLKNFPEHLVAKRSESAAFLIWYLEQYYRFDAVEAVDAVCDQPGDKGVDGIFINDSNSTITIFQSKISQRTNSTVGDAGLRDFLGTLQQFDTVEAASHLMQTAGNTQVASLIRRSGLLSKLASYTLRGEFVTNLDLDQNGKDFLRQHGDKIRFVGKNELVNSFISNERDLPVQKRATFDIFGFDIGGYKVDSEIGASIIPVKATQLVELDGIEDQSVFSFNVRGPLGRTSVNKDLVKSIRNPSLHKMFPLFHNGITIIAKEVFLEKDRLSIEGYYVVNGCQSLTSLYENRSYLTDDLRVLAKFILMDPASPQAKLITEYSNNQNGVRSRDFKSNSSIQIRLQNEFNLHYKDVFNYEIKRGETTDIGKSISNEDAGLYLMAFDHKEPWRTHYKYEVFEDKHSALFGRPEVTADRIVMLRIMDDEIKAQLPDLKEQLLARYKLTRHMIIYVLREMLGDDPVFSDISSNPQNFMRDPSLREKFGIVIGVFVKNIIIDINVESDDYEEGFDYRAKLKDDEWVKTLTRNMEKDFKKNVVRRKQDTFAVEWHNLDI